MPFSVQPRGRTGSDTETAVEKAMDLYIYIDSGVKQFVLKRPGPVADFMSVDLKKMFCFSVT